jgi:hypothetical protein
MTRKIATALLAALVALTMSVPAALAQNTATIDQGNTNGDQIADNCCNFDGGNQGNAANQNNQTNQAAVNQGGGGGDRNASNSNSTEQEVKQKNKRKVEVEL